MKDQALSQALQFDDPQRRLNALREYLQAFIMRSLHESEAGRAVAFVGGTALRFLKNLPRFSEDLDFSRVSEDGYEPVRWLRSLTGEVAVSRYSRDTSPVVELQFVTCNHSAVWVTRGASSVTTRWIRRISHSRS